MSKMSRLDDDPSSVTGQASKPLTLDEEHTMIHHVSEPPSAVFRGRLLQVLEKAFLHLGYGLQEDWVQSLKKIKINIKSNIKRLNWCDISGGAFEPYSNEGIEVGMLRGRPFYAIVGEITVGPLEGLRTYLIKPLEVMRGVEVSLQSVQRLVRSKDKADPNIRLHNFASIFEDSIDQQYWFMILLVTKSLLSSEKFEKWREIKDQTSRVHDLIYVKDKWEARKRMNGKPQGFPPHTAAQASSTGPPPSPPKIPPQPIVSQRSLPREVRALAVQQSPPLPSSSTVESEVHTPTVMKPTSKKATTISTILEYEALMAQHKKEQEDAQKEKNEIKQQISHYRQKLADATAKLEPSVQKLKAAEKKRKRTIERTSIGVKRQLLFRFEKVYEDDDEDNEEDNQDEDNEDEDNEENIEQEDNEEEDNEEEDNEEEDNEEEDNEEDDEEDDEEEDDGSTAKRPRTS